MRQITVHASLCSSRKTKLSDSETITGVVDFAKNPQLQDFWQNPLLFSAAYSFAFPKPFVLRIVVSSNTWADELIARHHPRYNPEIVADIARNL